MVSMGERGEERGDVMGDRRDQGWMPNDWLGMETFLPHRFPFIDVIFENLHGRDKWGFMH
jgi:hypothetical protein